MRNPFIEYVAKEKKEDIFHSSTYGKAQSGAIMGTSSNKTFSELKRARDNRKMVQSYEKSDILGKVAANIPRAKTFTPPSDNNAVDAPGAGAATGPSSASMAGSRRAQIQQQPRQVQIKK